jgi:hypothetical protein
LLIYAILNRVVCICGPSGAPKWSCDDDEDYYGVAEEEPDDVGAKENHLG